MSTVLSYSEMTEKKFATQDVYFTKPLVKWDSKSHDPCMDYGSLSSVCILSDQQIISQKSSYGCNYWSAANPTLPVSSTALPVAYPFQDRVMGENLSSMKKAKYFTSYVLKVRGACSAKVTFNHLKPLKRVISAMSTSDYNIKLVLKNEATPALKNYFRSYCHLLTANIENYNSEYVGGCLSVLNTNKKTVCFPGGLEFDKLNIRELVAEEDDKCLYKYKNGIEINVDNSIYEVNSTIIRDTGYCGIRCNNNKCSLIKFQDEDYTINTVETVDEKPTSICLSPYIEGESLIATDSGTVHMWNVGRGLKTLVLNKATRFQCEDNWRQVHYGACPQEIVLTDRTVAQMFDRRTKSDSSVDLFSVRTKILSDSERLTTACKHPANPYYHLFSTEHSLLLVDQRFPNHCVMHWNHLLQSSPALMSVYHEERNGRDDSVVLLASHNPAETCCFQFEQTFNNPVHSTQSPWRLSKISDICDYESPVLSTYCLLSNKRLNTSLCGVAALTGDDPTSLLTLQLDCHGELFYQVYSNNNGQSDITCSAGPGLDKTHFADKAQERAKVWMSSLERHVGSLLCDDGALPNLYTTNYSSTSKELMQTEMGNNACDLCLPKTIINESDSEDDDDDDDDDDHDDVVNDDICSSCGISLRTAKSLYKDNMKNKISKMCSNGFELLDSQIPPYSKLPHSSAKSKLLVKLWSDTGTSDITEQIEMVEKDTDRSKRRYNKAKSRLIKKAEKRKTYFKTLKRHGHDINKLYFDNKQNPKNLDKHVKILAAGYTGEDVESDTADTASSTVTCTFQSNGRVVNANLSMLARDSQNLTLLQTLKSLSSTNSQVDTISNFSMLSSEKQMVLRDFLEKSSPNNSSNDSPVIHNILSSNSGSSSNDKAISSQFKIPDKPPLKRIRTKSVSSLPSEDDSNNNTKNRTHGKSNQNPKLSPPSPKRNSKTNSNSDAGNYSSSDDKKTKTKNMSHKKSSQSASPPSPERNSERNSNSDADKSSDKKIKERDIDSANRKKSVDPLCSLESTAPTQPIQSPERITAKIKSKRKRSQSESSNSSIDTISDKLHSRRKNTSSKSHDSGGDNAHFGGDTVLPGGDTGHSGVETIRSGVNTVHSGGDTVRFRGDTDTESYLSDESLFSSQGHHELGHRRHKKSKKKKHKKSDTENPSDDESVHLCENEAKKSKKKKHKKSDTENPSSDESLHSCENKAKKNRKIEIISPSIGSIVSNTDTENNNIPNIGKHRRNVTFSPVLSSFQQISSKSLDNSDVCKKLNFNEAMQVNKPTSDVDADIEDSQTLYSDFQPEISSTQMSHPTIKNKHKPSSKKKKKIVLGF